MKYREVADRLRKLGCEYVRPGSGSHRIWTNPKLDRYTTIPDWGAKDIKPETSSLAPSVEFYATWVFPEMSSEK